MDETTGLPGLSLGGAPAISCSFVFWGKNWAWAGFRSQFKVNGPFEYSLQGTSSPLALSVSAKITRPTAHQLIWTIDLDAAADHADAVGGGIAFNVNLAEFQSTFGDPVLLPDRQGWTWGSNNHSKFELRIEPAPPALYFERDQKSQIRLFFFKQNVPKGVQHYVMKISTSEDVTIGPTLSEEFGLPNPDMWPADALDWRSVPVDLSFLNGRDKPVGVHGYVGASHGHLAFDDGTPARFWGTNLAAYTLFGTSREATKLQAHRLAELGFNLVRIHHHDSAWVTPNIFGDRTAFDTKSLRHAQFEKLDWWIKCLEDEGIYIWLDLEDGRQFKAADGIDGFDEISKGKPTANLKGFNYINKSIIDAMRSFNEEYLNHRNIYTGHTYTKDPGIIALLLTNENDVTNHFGNALLPDKQVPKHNSIYMAEAQAFATKYGLPKDKTWRSWEPGPSKLFLNDLEHRFDVNMIDQLRGLEAKIPVAVTSTWGNNPLSSLPTLTTGDIIDVHSYGTVDEVRKSPLYAASFIDWIAAAHVADRPLSISEWNVSPFPSADRHTAPILVAAFGDFQGWDAPMLFAYAQQPLNGAGGASNWDAYNDPGIIASLPAAALLFRRGDVLEAKTTFVFTPTSEELFGQSISPSTSVALRTAVEKGKLLIAMPKTVELPWLQKSEIPPTAVPFSDPHHSFLDHDDAQGALNADGLTHDWVGGVLYVNTARSQIATGWLGGKKIRLADVAMDLNTKSATVAVQTLDESAIRDSHRILISLNSRSLPIQQSKLLFRSEPVVGHLQIRAPGGLHLYKVSTYGRSSLLCDYRDGRYEMSLGRDSIDHWLVLEP